MFVFKYTLFVFKYKQCRNTKVHCRKVGDPEKRCAAQKKQPRGSSSRRRAIEGKCYTRFVKIHIKIQTQIQMKIQIEIQTEIQSQIQPSRRTSLKQWQAGN